MKNFKILFLLLITFLAINGCKKDKPENEPEQQDVEKVSGEIDIPANLNNSDIAIVSQYETVTPDTNGNFTIQPGNSIFAINISNNEIIYFSIAGETDTTANRNNLSTTGGGGSWGDGVNLNSLNTAASIIYYGIGVTGFRPDAIKNTGTMYDGFMDFIKSKQTTQLLKDDINDIIQQYGFLYLGALSDNLIENALQDILNCAVDIFQQVSTDNNLFNSGNGAVTGVNLVSPYLIYNTINNVGDFKIEIKDATYNTQYQRWELECNVFNGLPQYFAATPGYYDSNLGKIMYNKADLSNIILPYNTSAFYKDISSCNGFGKFIQDVKNMATHNWQYVLMNSTREFIKNDVTLRLPDNYNMMVLYNANASNYLKTLEIVQLAINQTKSVFGLLSAAADFSKYNSNGNNNSSLTQDEIDRRKIINELLSDFVTDLLSDPQFQGYIVNNKLQVTKDNIKDILLLVSDKLFSFLADNSVKVSQLVTLSHLGPNYMDLFGKEFSLQRKLVEKLAKFTAASCDIFMAKYQWNNSYNGFYFVFATNVYYPLVNATNVNVLTTTPFLKFNEPVQINTNLKCKIIGERTGYNTTTQEFPLTINNIEYI